MNLTLRPKRLTGIVDLVVSMVLAFSFGPFGSSRNIGTVLPVICGVFFGGLALWDFVALLPRSYSLTLDPAGFAVRLLFRQRYYRWSEVNAFSVGSSSKVVYNFSNADQRQMDRRRRGLWATFISDHNAVLPSRFGLSADELAETMNQWRWRALSTQPAPRAVNAN